jgi:hypothetical protein
MASNLKPCSKLFTARFRENELLVMVLNGMKEGREQAAGQQSTGGVGNAGDGLGRRAQEGVR